ncbi:RtcB family protein [Desulfonatronovibrio hydrogenovorans]|uniref:RtcB family protein n=1 Tax=Desulfonatronovibrio hydrogenovorans TaxID=53245 RepID=UPI00048DBD85|nr:RtcB family protein [Desulfonatronovibrio hydrogenovorans]
MNTSRLQKIAPHIFQVEPEGRMRVPALFFADKDLLEGMDDKVLDQLTNVASLPGISVPAMAMPDAHWGYGFPIGGVGAFDPELDGVISAGGVGFDIACGVRTIVTGIHKQEILNNQKTLADRLFQSIPAGLGSTGSIKIAGKEMDRMLSRGAEWAIKKGFGRKKDLERMEDRGTAPGARPEFVSDKARKRQENEMGTLGSGNHYLEVQSIDEIFDRQKADLFGLKKDDVVISIHCGSRGLGHQVATDYMRTMVAEAARNKIHLPDRDLAWARINSRVGQEYLGAMRAAMNCAMANRQIITHLVRETITPIFPDACLDLLYDVSHNTCREEYHTVDNKKTRLFVHRKGATRALGPGNPELPLDFMEAGQPVLIGGSMGTSSFILVGTARGMELSLGSACHGAGRSMSRKQAEKRFRRAGIIDQLMAQGIEIRGHSFRGLAEEAPQAYKDVNRVVQVTHDAGLAAQVARLSPLICIKG